MKTKFAKIIGAIGATALAVAGLIVAGKSGFGTCWDDELSDDDTKNYDDVNDMGTDDNDPGEECEEEDPD